MRELKQLYETIEISIATALANLHTSTVARVTAVGEKTISCQPVIQRVVDGRNITLPEFIEVPPIFLQGGGSYTAHPIAVGDYCLLFFTERCFDRWYEGQDFRPPAEFRMHDYSDGFALVGVNPRAMAITIPDVITHIGDTYAEGDYVQVGDYTHTGDRDQTGDYTQTGDQDQTGDKQQVGNYTLNGNLTVNGSLTVNAGSGDIVKINGVVLEITDGDIIADGISLKNHVHGGVEPGAYTTDGPQ